MPKKAFSLEKSFQRLEEILQSLESGEIKLEESIKLFEEGMALTNMCQKNLQELENRVKVLVEKNSGEFEEKDFQKKE